MSLGSWRVATRIAARTAWRSKGRTLLIAAMVGLPITGMAAADTLFRTAQLSADQQLTREIGQADFVAADDLGLITGAYGLDVPSSLRAAPGRTVEDRTKDLPTVRAAGGTVGDVLRNSVDFEAVTEGRSGAQLTVADLDNPVFGGLVVRRTGAAPVAPDEVVLTPAMLEAIGAEAGDSVELGGRKVRVVGTAVDPQDSEARIVYAPPGTVVPMTDPSQADRLWLISASADRDSAVRRALAATGMAVIDRTTLRQAIENRPRTPVDDTAIGTAVVVVGLAGLQIVLLASAAFAVGARRQRRDLGLIAAQGGERRHVRAVVLAAGIVVGVAASVVGVVLGIGIAAVARSPIESLSYELFGPFDIAPLDLLVIVLLGTGTALLASALPARTASRVPVLLALTGRRGQVRTPHKVTAVGAVGIVVGFVIATQGARPPAEYNKILIGAVIAELGFALCAPVLVGLAGRLARWTPLPMRLALRDSARNRGRSAPAVAAVMAALAATVALSIFLVSSDTRERERYVPSSPANVVYLEGSYDDAGRPYLPQAAAEAVAGALPGGRTVRIESLGECLPTSVTCTSAYGSRTQPGPGGGLEAYSGSVAVGGAELVASLTGGDRDPEIVRALAAGRLVTVGPVNGRSPVFQAQVESEVPRQYELPVRVVQVPGPLYQWTPSGYVSQSTANKLGLGTSVERIAWVADRAPSSEEMRRAADALRSSGLTGARLDREVGYQSDVGIVLLALVGVSVVITLGATAIATGLAGTEARPDLATLAAVGASPRVRRVLAMAQAASIAGTGAVLGLFAGMVPAYAVLNARADYPFVVPWSLVALVVVGVPLVAALLAGLFTRSKLPMIARMT